jgi:hypothetical protein
MSSSSAIALAAVRTDALSLGVGIGMDQKDDIGWVKRHTSIGRRKTESDTRNLHTTLNVAMETEGNRSGSLQIMIYYRGRLLGPNG